MKQLIFALIAGAFAASAAHAEGPYIGLGVASTDYNFKISGGSGVNYGQATNISGDGYKQSLKVFGGFDFTPMFGVEAGYTDLRKAEATYNIGPIPGRATADGKRAYVAGKATAPLNEQFSVFGKLGVGYKKSEFRANTLGYNHDDSTTGLYAGVGVQYNLSKQIGLTLEYERYGKKDEFGAKPDAITVAARYNF
ncbi:porin family protein [Oxalobacteraceae bacterium]|nr:porin family protein [Oxalobacteraceae bacterium]